MTQRLPSVFDTGRDVTIGQKEKDRGEGLRPKVIIRLKSEYRMLQDFIRAYMNQKQQYRPGLRHEIFLGRDEEHKEEELRKYEEQIRSTKRGSRTWTRESELAGEWLEEMGEGEKSARGQGTS